MAESIMVGIIVGAVLILAGRSFYRTFTGKGDGCHCGTKSCPAAVRPRRDSRLQTSAGCHCHRIGQARTAASP